MPHSPADRTRVLMHPIAEHDVNHTVRMLLGSLPPDIEVEPFSWRRAAKGGYDVLHLHWPEQLLGADEWWMRARLGSRVLALVAINRLRRTAMVWTVHNERPHERSTPFQRFVLWVWGRSVSARVFMYDAARPVRGRRGDLVIRHGDYSPLFTAASSRRGDGLLALGQVRPYKGIDSLLTAYRDLTDRPRLTIAGAAVNADYADSLRRLAARMPTVRFDIRHIPDDELVRVVEASALVVLPYAKVYNSGVALLALTLRRPILVPESPTMRELARLVGSGWVHFYGGALSSDDLETALAAPTPSRDPDLSELQWDELGRAYAALYRRLSR